MTNQFSSSSYDEGSKYLAKPDPDFAAYIWPKSKSWGAEELVRLQVRFQYQRSVLEGEDDLASIMPAAGVREWYAVLKHLSLDLASSQGAGPIRDSLHTQIKGSTSFADAFYRGLDELLKHFVDEKPEDETTNIWKALDAHLDLPPELVLSAFYNPLYDQFQCEREKRLGKLREDQLMKSKVYDLMSPEFKRDLTRQIATGIGSTLLDENYPVKGQNDSKKKVQVRSKKKRKVSRNRAHLVQDTDILAQEQDVVQPADESVQAVLPQIDPRYRLASFSAAELALWESGAVENDWLGALLNLILHEGGFSDVLEYSNEVQDHCIWFRRTEPWTGIPGPTTQSDGRIRLSSQLPSTNALPLINIEKTGSRSQSESPYLLKFAAVMLSIVQDRMEHTYYDPRNRHIARVYSIGVCGRRIHLTRVDFPSKWLDGVLLQRFNRYDDTQAMIHQTFWFRVDMRDELHHLTVLLCRIMAELKDDIVGSERRI